MRLLSRGSWWLKILCCLLALLAAIHLGTIGQAVLAADPLLPPSNLTISWQNDDAVLRWVAAKDPRGIERYALERSVDSANWTVLELENPTKTVYTDTATGFNVRYFYRLKAVNKAGESSPYITADITTAKFEANLSGALGTTLKSEDGLTTVKLPAGTSNRDVSCHLSSNLRGKAESVNSEQQRITGPVAVICSLPTGQDIMQLERPVSFEISLAQHKPDQYAQIQVWQHDESSNKWQQVAAQYDQQTKVINFASAKTDEFIVVGVVKQSTLLSALLWLIPVVIVIFAGAIWIALRQQQQRQYEAYLRRKYYEY